MILNQNSQQYTQYRFEICDVSMWLPVVMRKVAQTHVMGSTGRVEESQMPLFWALAASHPIGQN